MKKELNDNKYYIDWLKKYQIAVRFYQENGHLDIKNNVIYEDIRLGA
ncbi:MAG: helicase associated domain-containing protein [Bacilli bacterium]|nr:helicase associated domain-containing protein [Bacilli bacterium]